MLFLWKWVETLPRQIVSAPKQHERVRGKYSILLRMKSQFLKETRLYGPTHIP